MTARPVARPNPRRIILLAVVVLVVLFAIDKLVIHHRNRYESTADAITKAIAKNDMKPVEHAFNAVDRAQLEDRARVGELSNMVAAMGDFKASKQHTPAAWAAGYHHFTERFSKGTLEEKYELDADGKITRFHLGPSATP